jgi:chloramphenicol-sensitive protein RarD
LAGLILGLNHINKVTTALADKKVMGLLVCAGILLGGNWWLFIWSVNNDHLLEASLGYYINPLFNVLFGFVFLGERFRRLQKIAVLLAFIGVAILIVSFGDVPYIALSLALSFSLYGLVRKQINVDSIPGLFIETVLMLPLALGYWLWTDSPTSNFANNSTTINVLFICAGLVTTAPLLCFTSAARRIMYSTLGFFQYIGPTLMFVIAIMVYNEPFNIERVITFGFVWLALAVFTYDGVRHYRKQKKLLNT